MKPSKKFGNSLYMRNLNNWQERTEKAKAYESDNSSDLYKSVGRKYTYSQNRKPARILNFYKQKKLDYDAEFKEEVDYLYQNAKYKTYQKDLKSTTSYSAQANRNSSPTRKFNEFYKQYTEKQKRNLMGKSPDSKKKYDYSAQIVVRKFHEKMYPKKIVY